MEKLCKLFDAIDARMPQDDWSGLAEDFRDIMECDFVAYYSMKLPMDDVASPTIIMTNKPRELADYWEKGYYRMQFVDEDKLPAFAPFKSSDVVEASVLERHPIYQRWGRYCGFFHVLFAPLLLTSFEMLMLALARPRSANDFDEHDSYRLGLTARYLRRFVQAQNVLRPLESFDLSDYFKSPVAILDGRTLVAANDAFESWCSAYGVLNINNKARRITVSDNTLEKKLLEVDRKLQIGNTDPAQPPKSQVSINIGDAQSGKRFTLQIMPLASTDYVARRFVWFVHDVSPNLAIANYGAQIGLTPTEIEILSDLARGISARSIAEMTGRQYATIRWHIQNILPKCGVKSQRELLYRLFSESGAI